MSAATATATATAPAVDAAPRVDGRRLRGDASRLAILDAAVAVIVADGVAALTHRRVAEVAEVPLARVSYHFPKVDDLMVAAATRYLEDFQARFADLAEVVRTGRRDPVEACTDFLMDLVTTGAEAFLAVVEVRLALHRRGRGVDDLGVVDSMESLGLDSATARSIVAAMFGFAVLAATEPAPPARSIVRNYVGSVMGVS